MTRKEIIYGVDSLGKRIVIEVRSITTLEPNPLIESRDSYAKTLEENQRHTKELSNRKLDIPDKVRGEFENLPSGFLEELNALVSVLEGDIFALIFYCVLFVFLLSLELLVITAKMGSRQCDYDLLVEHQLRLRKQATSM